MPETNYWSGEDYVVEFLGYRFGFNHGDFQQRVRAAAVKLGLLEANELDDDETADLVELASRGWIEEPRSSLGHYLIRHWERISLVDGESLVYWLRKLIFRGAWLDHRVKESLLEVVWDEDAEEFAYRDLGGGQPPARPAPAPAWHAQRLAPRPHPAAPVAALFLGGGRALVQRARKVVLRGAVPPPAGEGAPRGGGVGGGRGGVPPPRPGGRPPPAGGGAGAGGARAGAAR